MGVKNYRKVPKTGFKKNEFQLINIIIIVYYMNMHGNPLSADFRNGHEI